MTGCPSWIGLAGKVHDCDWTGPHKGHAHYSHAAGATWTEPSDLDRLRPIGYVFTDTAETMQPPTSQRFVSHMQAAVARDVWEARYGFKGRFVVCALVPVLDLIDKHAREGQ